MVVRPSAFNEVLRDLRGCGALAIPESVYPSFVAFCNSRGYYPASGSVIVSADGVLLRCLFMPVNR